MDVEAAILKRLLDNGAVQSLVGDQIAWVERIPGESYPGITLQVIDEELRQHLKGFDTLQRIDVQIDGWSWSHAQGKQIKDAVRSCLVPQTIIEGYRFNRGFVRARDLNERAQERTVFRPSMDFIFHYSIVP